MSAILYIAGLFAYALLMACFTDALKLGEKYSGMIRDRFAARREPATSRLKYQINIRELPFIC